MGVKPIEPQRLSQLVDAARKGDIEAREELIGFHRSFVHRAASSISGKSLDPRNDDEVSIALLAFNEAIDKYEGRRGASFLTYASHVIRCRLIDYFRGTSRQPDTVPLVIEWENEDQFAPVDVREAWARFEAQQEEERTAAEIDLLMLELSQYGITMNDLVLSTPKHQDTKASLLRTVGVLLRRPDLLGSLKRTRQLPIKDLQELTGLSRKVLESGRRYIVAVAVVMTNPELSRIRDHIRLPEVGEGISAHA